MVEFIKAIMPNVYAYRSRFFQSCEATLQMFVIAGLISFALGLLFGVVLTVTREGGIRPNRLIYRVLDVFVNVFRSIPFVILLIFLIPFTRTVLGTAIGVKGAIIPLVFGVVPFFTRQVEAALAGVSPGKLEAARSMGSGTMGLIFRVYLHEAVPDLIRVTTITALGRTDEAHGRFHKLINYGQNQQHQDIVNVCVVVLLIFVCLLQALGSFLARKTTNRKLFARTEK